MPEMGAVSRKRRRDVHSAVADEGLDLRLVGCREGRIVPDPVIREGIPAELGRLVAVAATDSRKKRLDNALGGGRIPMKPPVHGEVQDVAVASDL